MEEYSPEQIEEIARMIITYASYSHTYKASHSKLFGVDKEFEVDKEGVLIAKEMKKLYQIMTPLSIQKRVEEIEGKAKSKDITKKI